MIRLTLFMMALAIPFAPAHATYWLECRVEASIDGVDKMPGGYSITLHSAVITDGHENPGGPCLEDRLGQSIDIKSEALLTVGETAELKYDYYDAMGPNGIIETVTWSLWSEGDSQ